MAPTFTQLEDLIGRLPIDADNYWVFEKLIEQPYDVYRPILDMLFDGTIVVEDLMIPPGSASLAVTGDAETADQRLNSWNATSASVGSRCVELITGKRPGGVVITRDTSSIAVAEDGSIGSTYAAETQTAVGADATVISPNPIELSRAGSLTDAQKAVQEDYAAALEPDIG